MSVIRVNKTKDYTVMSNYHLKDRRLSLKAKGLLSIMLSLSDEWQYSIAGLVAISKENETAIKSTLHELKEYGYLVVIKKMPNETDSGRIEYEYNIYEHPHEPQKQVEEKQDVENLPVEPQGVENQGQLNTNISNTKKANTKESNNNNISAEFENLWKMYPRKIGKQKAYTAYAKARKSGVTFEQVQQGIENYNKQINAKQTETEYIKHGSTWFGNGCWGDEYDFAPRTSTDKKMYGANGIAINPYANDDLDGIL